MRTPISHCLAWPTRMPVPLPRLDLAALGRLEFFAPDPVRFPALRLAREALQAGGGAPTILNAANEVAVALFLDRRLGFLDIAAVVEETLSLLRRARRGGAGRGARPRRRGAGRGGADRRPPRRRLTRNAAPYRC